MPSPLGHALAGAAAGWAIAGSPSARGSFETARRHLWRLGAWFAGLGMLPDVDLLLTAHRGPTHSMAAALIVGLAALGLTRRGRLGLAAAAAYATHPLLDWLGSDTSPPIGIMALWPLSQAYFQSDVHLFSAISRRYWMAGFWEHNLRAIGWELVVLLPPVLLALVSIRRQPLVRFRKERWRM
jgi:hypothetical protein